MPAPDPVTLPLGQRLMESFKAFLGTTITSAIIPAYVAPADVTAYVASMEAYRQALAALVIRRRDEDTPITPESDADKKLRIICTASDEGRAKLGTPIRSFRLELTIRANALVANGQSDPFHQAFGALEALLDGLNLQLALTSLTTWKIAVMLANREPGCSFTVEKESESKSIRRQSYALKVRAVGTEHTA